MKKELEFKMHKGAICAVVYLVVLAVACLAYDYFYFKATGAI